LVWYASHHSFQLNLALLVTSIMADSDTTKGKAPLRADQVEVTIRHALEGVEIKVPVRKTATFTI